MAEEFEKRGYNSHVIFLCDREVNYIPSGSFDVLIKSKKINAFNLLILIYRLYKHFRATRPAAVYGFQPAANAFSSIACKLAARSTFIATQRNPSDKQSRIGRLLDRLIGSSPFYDANIAVSDSVKKSYEEYGPRYCSKMVTVHNGTPILEPTNLDARAARARFSMPQGATILGIVARLHKQKNIEFALSILPLMPDVLLFVAGDGPEEENLKHKARALGVDDRLKLLGSLRGTELTAFYSAIDVFLLTSLYEGFGRTIVEALSQGLPVVANDIPIAREVAGHVGRYATLDPIRWKHEINEALNGHNPAESIKRSRKFSISEMADSYIKVAGL